MPRGGEPAPADLGVHRAAVEQAVADPAGQLGRLRPVGGDQERAGAALEAGGRDARVLEVAALAAPVGLDRLDGLAELGQPGRLHAEAAGGAVAGGDRPDRAPAGELVERGEQVADDHRVAHDDVAHHRADVHARRRAGDLELVQVGLLVDGRGVGDADPVEAVGLARRRHRPRLLERARQHHEPELHVPTPVMTPPSTEMAVPVM